MKPSILAFEDAAFGYDGQEMLTGMAFRLEPGGFYFLTGPSGAGKTTLLRLAYLELMPTRGQLTLFGRGGHQLDRDEVARTRQRIGIVHQDCQFLDHLSLRENIALPLVVAGRDPADQTEDINQLLQWVGLAQRKCAAARVVWWRKATRRAGPCGGNVA